MQPFCFVLEPAHGPLWGAIPVLSEEWKSLIGPPLPYSFLNPTDLRVILEAFASAKYDRVQQKALRRWHFLQLPWRGCPPQCKGLVENRLRIDNGVRGKR